MKNNKKKAFLPRTQLGKKLLRIRENAKKDLTLLSADEVLEEVRKRRQAATSE